MSLPAGSHTSVGRLLAIADNLRDGGAEKMPGYCCMDVAANSELFGYNVSDDGSLHACSLLSPFHRAVHVPGLM